MSMHKDYLELLPESERGQFERIIAIATAHVPNAKEGLSYGLPSLKLNGRPLIGFSSNQYGLNIYPFDPKIIAAVKGELDGFELSKGVVRFSVEHPIPEHVLLVMLDMRVEALGAK